MDGTTKAKVRFAIASEGVVIGYSEKNGESTRYREIVYDAPLNMDHASDKSIKLGGQESNATKWKEYNPASGTDRKAFKGAFANVKLWSRAMSDEELLAVLAGGDGMQWSIGAPNGSSDEFGGNPVSEFDPAANAWSQMQKTLDAASPTLTFRTKMRTEDEGLQKSLRVLPMLPEGATGSVSLSVNGEPVESADLEDGKEHVFVIPAAKWTSDPSGFVTVSISRTGEVAGILEFDTISLSGGWQVGYADKSVLELVSNERLAPPDFFIGDSDVSNHVRKATYSAANNTSPHRMILHFWVDGRMARKSAAVFSSAVPNKADGEALAPFEVYLNGSCIHRGSVKKGDTINAQIERGVLREGLNAIELRNCSDLSTMWTHYDYFRMEFKREFSPFAITVR